MKENKWICVFDKLPDVGTDVLCYICYFPCPILSFMKIIHYGKNGKWDKFGKFITHWMPLPDAPEV